jgi:L-lactate dehydrogenase complex protein LldG
MVEHNTFIESIGAALGFSSSDQRNPEHCPDLFSTRDTSDVLELINGRTQEEKRALLEEFRENAALINLVVHTAPTVEDAAQVISRIISDSEPEFESAQQITQHDHPDIAALKLSEKLDEGVVIHTTTAGGLNIREKTISSYIGITSPSWGVAGSATLLQVTKPGQPRSTSLVPSIHIGLLRLENMLADLAELYAVLHRDPPSSSYVFISGPSKTADIESHLVQGAHGPKSMHVVVIDG